MPKPKRINARTIWDRKRLDEAFDALPDEEGAIRQMAPPVEESGSKREKKTEKDQSPILDMMPREGIIRNHRHYEPLLVLSMVA